MLKAFDADWGSEETDSGGEEVNCNESFKIFLYLFFKTSPTKSPTIQYKLLTSDTQKFKLLFSLNWMLHDLYSWHRGEAEPEIQKIPPKERKGKKKKKNQKGGVSKF